MPARTEKVPLILLSWNNRNGKMFSRWTHELGHAGHFRLCNGAQAILDTEVSSYFVEAPSTMNELLMAHYLLKNNPRTKRFPPLGFKLYDQQHILS